MTVAIKIENLSKQYRLGLVSTRTLSHDLNRWWQTTIRGKEDPYLRIGEVNDRATRGDGEYVWALRDINLEVEQGEVLGIIGKNGAGKSTLLKILSKVTAPTTGTIKTKGRIASLLEVGTGFHYEMTGRENIYMNGAIMGMSKAEINRKLDEIIDFAGVERYIDTPVKRYSSGMIVRLGFAVAAHLEPEILVVDEVLAVGDAEFQKKAIGKMQDISHGQGRTVLFVSHNMASVLNLCNTGMLLKDGKIFKIDSSNKIVEEYLLSLEEDLVQTCTRRFGNKKVEIMDYSLSNATGKLIHQFFMGDDILVNLSIKFHETIGNVDVGLNIKNNMDELFTHVANFDNGFIIKSEAGKDKEIKIRLCNIFFSPGHYKFDISIVSGSENFDIIEGCLPFTLTEGAKINRNNFPTHVKVYTPSIWE
jgi:lipopolysaccharide transport system ATP-binding protein